MIDRTDRRMCMTAAWDEVIQFNERYFRGWRSVDEVFYANALAGEVGEVCNAVKHRAGGGTNKSNPSAFTLMDELADVFIYMELLVERMGLDVTSLADAIHTKVLVNKNRIDSSTVLKSFCEPGGECDCGRRERVSKTVFMRGELNTGKIISFTLFKCKCGGFWTYPPIALRIARDRGSIGLIKQLKDLGLDLSDTDGKRKEK